MLPDSFTAYLTQFSFCFTEPTHQRFLTIITGWILCRGKRTVTGVIRAAGVVGARHHSGFHRFFSQARWSMDPVGMTLSRLLLSMLPKDALVVLTVDDTLARHTGKHIASGAMHRDPLLSTGKKPYFHFGITGWCSPSSSAFPIGKRRSLCRCSCAFTGPRSSTKSWDESTTRRPRWPTR